MNRKVPFKTILPLMKNRPTAILGMVWTAGALILLPVIYSLLNSFGEPYENYNHKVIIKQGSMVTAKILSINDRSNITVNGEHPEVISYSYIFDGKQYFDKFQTFDHDKTAMLEPGSPLKIKVLNKQSAPVDLKPYKFPMLVFMPIFGVFFIGGIIFMLIGLLPVIKMYVLYKNGIVRDATVTAMTIAQGLPVTNKGRRVEVFYYHETANGQRVYNDSFTTDFSILGEKKTGDNIKILVAADNENKSCLLPKGLML